MCLLFYDWSIVLSEKNAHHKFPELNKKNLYIYNYIKLTKAANYHSLRYWQNNSKCFLDNYWLIIKFVDLFIFMFTDHSTYRCSPKLIRPQLQLRSKFKWPMQIKRKHCPGFYYKAGNIVSAVFLKKPHHYPILYSSRHLPLQLSFIATVYYGNIKSSHSMVVVIWDKRKPLCSAYCPVKTSGNVWGTEEEGETSIFLEINFLRSCMVIGQLSL